MGANKTYHYLITEALGRPVSPIERYALEKKIRRRLKNKYYSSSLTEENCYTELFILEKNFIDT